jgi:hypothetical protein
LPTCWRSSGSTGSASRSPTNDLHQLDPDIRHAVLGNAGTLIAFRVGAEDAPYLVREFRGYFDEIDLMQLPNYDIYISLMIDGAPSKSFSATTLAVADSGGRLLSGERNSRRL